ncbi:unnamed protein product [Dicrocoelium dendriticum]|nr:unnamed protein product [Dicrocoelium dendriticum]
MLGAQAHYLFKHGHIPESLGGLTPTAEEAALLRKRPLDDSAGCSSNFSDSSDTSVESTRHVNMRRTSRQAIRCTRKLGPMIRFPQALRAGQPVGSASSSQTDDACTREIPSKQRSTDSFPSSESHKRIRKTRSKTNSVDSTELPNPSGDAPSHTNAEQVPHSEACWVLRPSQGGTCPSSSVYQCKLCQPVCSRLFNLPRHPKQAHRDVFQFYCGYCGFRADALGALDEHLARHLRLKQFACENLGSQLLTPPTDSSPTIISPSAGGFSQ